MQICTEPPPSLRKLRTDLPTALDGVVKRAMSKSPEDRYPDAATLKEALSPFWRAGQGLHGKAVTTQPQIAAAPVRAATEPELLLPALPTQPSGDETPEDDVEPEPLAPFLVRRGPWIAGGSLSLVGALALAMSLPTSPAERSPRPSEPEPPAQKAHAPGAARPGAPQPSVPSAAGVWPAGDSPGAHVPVEQRTQAPAPTVAARKPAPRRSPNRKSSATAAAFDSAKGPAASAKDAGTDALGREAPHPARVPSTQQPGPTPSDSQPPSYRFPRRQLKEVFPAP
jgi:hypothetical protein